MVVVVGMIELVEWVEVEHVVDMYEEVFLVETIEQLVEWAEVVVVVLVYIAQTVFLIQIVFHLQFDYTNFLQIAQVLGLEEASADLLKVVHPGYGFEFFDDDDRDRTVDCHTETQLEQPVHKVEEIIEQPGVQFCYQINNLKKKKNTLNMVSSDQS